ncbi:biotin/lipoyl-binding protein [Leptolyngbya sp. FACHB-17]|nr:biotin/lipoyl-binding protein [Leptolyngbya sp. FACHB-17]
MSGTVDQVFVEENQEIKTEQPLIQLNRRKLLPPYPLRVRGSSLLPVKLKNYSPVSGSTSATVGSTPIGAT